MKKEVVFTDAREMLLREVPSTSSIIVETALMIINNTIANKYKVYESDR